MGNLEVANCDLKAQIQNLRSLIRYFMKKNESQTIILTGQVEPYIHLIRGYKVILDQDLAALYGVDTGNFNRAIKRNQKRFPEDFAFRLTENE